MVFMPYLDLAAQIGLHKHATLFTKMKAQAQGFIDLLMDNAAPDQTVWMCTDLELNCPHMA